VVVGSSIHASKLLFRLALPGSDTSNVNEKRGGSRIVNELRIVSSIRSFLGLETCDFERLRGLSEAHELK
jgi:hypothetical protein